MLYSLSEEHAETVLKGCPEEWVSNGMIRAGERRLCLGGHGRAGLFCWTGMAERNERLGRVRRNVMCMWNSGKRKAWWHKGFYNHNFWCKEGTGWKEKNECVRGWDGKRIKDEPLRVREEEDMVAQGKNCLSNRKNTRNQGKSSCKVYMMFGQWMNLWESEKRRTWMHKKGTGHGEGLKITLTRKKWKGIYMSFGKRVKQRKTAPQESTGRKPQRGGRCKGDVPDQQLN